MFNLEGRIGGDAELSHRGDEYARKLPQLVRASVGVSFFFLFSFSSSFFFFCVFSLREHIIIVRSTNDPVPVPSAKQPPPFPPPILKAQYRREVQPLLAISLLA